MSNNLAGHPAAPPVPQELPEPHPFTPAEFGAWRGMLRVHSTVFRWRFSPRFDELGVEESGFLAFLRSAFAQKRKTLVNNLRAAGISPGTAMAAFEAASVSPTARAEALPLETLAALLRVLRAKNAGENSSRHLENPSGRP